MSEKINKISLSSNDDKRLQSTDSVETYGYRTSKSLSRIKEKNKCKNNKNNTKMINFDHITKESIKERNPNWPKTSDHSYIILRIRSSGSPSLPPHPPHPQKKIGQETDIDKIYSYAKDPNKAKYQLFIKKCENSGLQYFKDSKSFIEHSNDMDDIYKTIVEYNPNKKHEILIAQ